MRTPPDLTTFLESVGIRDLWDVDFEEAVLTLTSTNCETSDEVPQ